MALWSALVVTVDALVCVYEWVWVGFCFCHSFLFLYSFFSYFGCFLCDVFCCYFHFSPQCSFFNSITNLIKVQEVTKNTSSVSAGSTSTQTFTVTACPSGYSWKYLSTSTGWGTVSSVSLSGTTLTVTVLNVSNGSHGISFRGVLVYYPSTWNI